MLKRHLLLFLSVGTMVALMAQQTTTGLLALDREGGQKIFLLANYPRMMLQTVNGIPSFIVLDTRGNAKTAVKTCIFSDIADEPCTPVKTANDTTIWDDELPFTWEGFTFTEAGSLIKILQNTTGCDSTVTFTLRIRYRNIVLQENKDADFYNNFAEYYNSQNVTTATLNRQFAYGVWSTLCLPFNVNLGQMIALGLSGRVYEFRYAEQLDNATLQVYFSAAQSIEAGKGYIVNANTKLANKTSFVFSNVTICTDGDNEDITSLTGYNNGSAIGSIYLVGTLRTGLLPGYADAHTYLGLKNNKLYYPNSTSGTSVRAYRGFFRCEALMGVQRIRIITDGEARGEWLIDGSERLVDAPADVHAPSRMVIDNGVLYIERNGIRYDAQGKRIK